MHRILTVLVAAIGPPMVRMLCSTNRLSTSGNSTIDHYVTLGGNILACWHSRLLYLVYYYSYRARLPQAFVLLSRSRDGDYAYAIARAMGHLAIRGSTRRGGARAARAVMQALADGYNVLITPDGPRGPAFNVQRGIIWLASATGARIIPASYDASSKWTLGSWDRFIVPRPFGKVHIAVGEPILVPPHMDDHGIEQYRVALELELKRLDAASSKAVSSR